MSAATPPSTLACLECRRKHVRCNATSPPCSRCSRRGLHCRFVPSRRGKGPRPEPPSHRQTAVSLEPQHATGPNHDADPGMIGTGSTSPDSLAGTRQSALSHADRAIAGRPSQPSPQQSGSSTIPPRAASPLICWNEEQLINAYFSHFHAHHPLLLPYGQFRERSQPQHLRLVVQLIGSQYVCATSTQTIAAAYQASRDVSTAPTAADVQSTLLYALFLYTTAEPERAALYVAKACDASIDLGLNELEGAARHAGGDLLLAESLRRTWWEIYVLDAVLCATQRQSQSRCETVPLTAGLPCKESMYNGGMPPFSLVSLNHFDARLFTSEDHDFSSACYRVDAARMLRRVSALSKPGMQGTDNVRALDNAIAAWKLHLPATKARIINSQGERDQVMVQANVFIHMASLILHFPRSELPVAHPYAASIACAAHITSAPPASELHAIKATWASNDIADVAGLPIGQHSPLVIPGLVLACIVQLAACSAQTHHDLAPYRDRIALMAGMLKQAAKTWPPVCDALRAINKAATAIFSHLQQVDTLADFPFQDFDIQGLFDDWARFEEPSSRGITEAG